MGPGPLIAIYVVLLYAVLGPLVLFAIYVLFDGLEKLAAKPVAQKDTRKDPALWGWEDVDRFVR